MQMIATAMFRAVDSVSELEEVLESNLDSVAMQAGAQQLNIKIVLMGRRSGVRVSQDVALFWA